MNVTNRVKKLGVGVGMGMGVCAGACLIALVVYFLSPSPSSALEVSLAEDHQVFRTLQWTDLMPDSDLQAILNAPEITHDGEEEYYSLPMQGLSLDGFELDEEAKLDEANRAFQEALVSSKVRPELDGEHIRVPGFMVPIEMDGPKNVTEFFLVPYYGACIHEPPPPPNQIIHIKYPQGFYLDDLFIPVWVAGTAHTTSLSKSGVNAAYSMSEVQITLYTEAPEADDGK
ncbi:DUF3299 domain-containing protein [Porticoccus sp. W117]|uniref:DUF3299 domain-containing protein n=1 Tax=Porticoccus sp. W117 TaxID=3054777 RepID=UPI002591E03E|nr:DUF3299 domain-containing protein [Porticoccus sp. W117]MDM3870013.1 DUF3299 domain-containing protein [Porticoccus sp. W117]